MRILIWPDGTWIHEDESENIELTGRSDDYEIREVSEETLKELEE